MDKALIIGALAEDIGSGDVSASLLVQKIIKAQVICKQQAIICGLDYFEQSFYQLSNSININWYISAGEEVEPGAVLCQLSGDNRAIISAERTALNFLQTLSATATKTNELVRKIAGTQAKILDTRKTLPLLREAQKQAVVFGGGVNHRLGLFDAIILKENHLNALGGLVNAIDIANSKYPDLDIIIEVENLDQLQTALNRSRHLTRILCDNFSTADLYKAVRLSAGKISLEVSGNINESNILDYANTGVDYISTGIITKNISAIDLSLRFL